MSVRKIPLSEAPPSEFSPIKFLPGWFPWKIPSFQNHPGELTPIFNVPTDTILISDAVFASF